MLPVYVDLWADISRSPLELIGEALRGEIMRHESAFKKVLKRIGLSKIQLVGAHFDFGSSGASQSLSLSDAIAYLHEATRKSVLLIIDEAQHALNSAVGVQSMFAVKAARDRLNQGTGESRLHLVLTGSHRDKLAHLVLKKDQPFFGAQVTSFPLLGKAFTDSYTDWVNPLLGSRNAFAKEDMYSAFELVGFRPEILKSLVAEVALDYGDSAHLGDLIRTESELLRSRLWNEFDAEFSSLTSVQKAVLSVLIHAEKDFSPFSEEAMRLYREQVKDDTHFGAPNIQSAATINLYKFVHSVT